MASYLRLEELITVCVAMGKKVRPPDSPCCCLCDQWQFGRFGLLADGFGVSDIIGVHMRKSYSRIGPFIDFRCRL